MFFDELITDTAYDAALAYIIPKPIPRHLTNIGPLYRWCPNSSGVGRTPQCGGADQPRRPVRAALWADGTADFVHDPRAALHDLSRRPRESGGPGRATRPRIPGFPLTRERRNTRTSDWRWSR